MLNSGTFWRTVISGFIATFIMMMIAVIQSGIGLPAIDIGHLIKAGFNEAHVDEPYGIMWGNAAYYMGGILLALIWVIFLQKRIPGNWVVQGFIFGVIISLAAGLVISPLVSLAAGDAVGIFYFDTWFPGLLLIAGFTMHLGYGIVLLLCLKYAGVSGLESNP